MTRRPRAAPHEGRSQYELRKEQTGKTKVNYSLGYHLRNGMFGHDGAYGTDLSVNPQTGMVAVFMVQCTSGDQWVTCVGGKDNTAHLFFSHP